MGTFFPKTSPFSSLLSSLIGQKEFLMLPKSFALQMLVGVSLSLYPDAKGQPSERSEPHPVQSPRVKHSETPNQPGKLVSPQSPLTEWPRPPAAAG